MIAPLEIYLGYLPAGTINGYIDSGFLGYAKSIGPVIPGPPIDFSDPLNSMYVVLISTFI